jgi:predicted aspartyl protease
MRQRAFFAGSMVLFLGLVSSGQLHAQNFVKPAVSSTMPFELVSGFLVVVNGQIGELDGLKFILDTGSTHSLIDRTLANKLKLQRGKGEVMNFDTNISVDWADIAELRVGPIRAVAVRVMVVDLDQYSELTEHADGIIGLDLLARTKKLSIDFERRAVFFQLPEAGSADRSSFACIVVPIVVQGVPVHLVVDTGLREILLYRNRLRERLPDMRTEGESKNVRIGRLKGMQVRLPQVRIVGPEMVSTVILIDDPQGDAMVGVDGFLGSSSLKAKRIEFDFDAKVFRWQ